VLLLEGVFLRPANLELCSRLDLWHAVHCDAQIDMLAAHQPRCRSAVPHYELGTYPGWASRPSSSVPFGVDEPERRCRCRRYFADERHFSDADGARGYPPAPDRCFERTTQDLPGERDRQQLPPCAPRRQLRVSRAADWVRAGILCVNGSGAGFPEHDGRAMGSSAGA